MQLRLHTRLARELGTGKGSGGLARGADVQGSSGGAAARLQWAGMFPGGQRVYFVPGVGEGGAGQGSRPPGPLGLGRRPAFHSQGAFRPGEWEQGRVSGSQAGQPRGTRQNPWIPAPDKLQVPEVRSRNTSGPQFPCYKMGFIVMAHSYCQALL